MQNLIELETVIESYISIQKSKKHIITLEKRLREQEQTLTRLNAQLQKEEADVLNLKKKHLRELFYSVLGNVDEQYEIERQEYLMALLKYNECNQTVELIEFQLKLLHDKIKKEGEVNRNLDIYMNERKNLLVNKYPHIKEELNNLDRKIDTNLIYKRELYEVTIIALKTKSRTELMIHELQKINDQNLWGYQSYKKSSFINSKMSKVQSTAYELGQLLLNLSKELEDIYRIKQISSPNRFNEFTHFVNIFHNQLITDWIINLKVQNTIACLLNIHKNVERIEKTMKNQVKNTEILINYIFTKRKELVVESIKK